MIYTCLRLGLPELPPETVPESQVPEQVLSQDERFELCITVDPINPIIWYSDCFIILKCILLSIIH